MYVRGISSNFDIGHLTNLQREVLVDHALGPVPFVAGSATANAQTALLQKGLLKPGRKWRPAGSSKSGGHTTNKRPEATELSESGREVVCIVLGKYADALTRVGADYERRLLPPSRWKKEEEETHDLAEGPDVRQL